MPHEKRYTLHFELSCGTLDDAYTSCSMRRKARVMARKHAADITHADVVRIVVCDAHNDGQTVDAFETRHAVQAG